MVSSRSKEPFHGQGNPNRVRACGRGRSRDRGGNVRVVVIPLPVVGWGVKIISAPAEAVNARAFVDQIASRLRVKFELKP
jgi:hypothetical protein